MATAYLTQDGVERRARELVRSARHTLDLASPWVEGYPIQRLLAEALPRIRAGELSVRLVYRVAEEDDLRITDLPALETLAADGVSVRFSRRLHAKLVIADGERALVGSSNLTRRGGFGYRERPEWRNEEGVVYLDGEPAVAEAAAHFEAIWQAADELAPDLVGVVMDFPSVGEFRFVAVRELACGQLVAVADGRGGTVVAEVVELTTYNHSFPQMTEEMFLTQGLGGSPPRRVTVPDLPTLFSHPVKDQGFLVAKTYFRPESAFQIARARALAHHSPAGVAVPVAPVAPGSDVRLPAAELLRRLLGRGDLRLGRLLHHPEVGVWLRSEEILSRHLAVLGMTGSGKSNAVLHLVRELRPSERGLRVFVVDTHGEYAERAAELDREHALLEVTIPDRIDLLDFEMVKEHFAVERMTPAVKSGLRAAGRETSDPASFAEVLASSTNEVLQEIAAQVAEQPDAFCVGEQEPRIVLAETGEEADLERPGVWVLDLRETATFEVRARKCAILVGRVFQTAKLARGARPALLVVDEAHNYVPERTTGFMAEASRHGSLGALTTVAVEGRKFAVGLVVVSQRPSRVAKDILAQANSQLVFRLANLEDLAYVRESFEAASASLLDELPRLPTGVCLCAGTMVDLPVRCDVPLFAPRRRFELGAAALPPQEQLERAVAAVVPQAELVADAPELVVFATPEVEVTVRSLDGRFVLDVDGGDEGLAERLCAAVEAVLATAAQERS